MKLDLNLGKAGTISYLAHFPSIDPQWSMEITIFYWSLILLTLGMNVH